MLLSEALLLSDDLGVLEMRELELAGLLEETELWLDDGELEIDRELLELERDKDEMISDELLTSDRELVDETEDLELLETDGTVLLDEGLLDDERIVLDGILGLLSDELLLSDDLEEAAKI